MLLNSSVKAHLRIHILELKVTFSNRMVKGTKAFKITSLHRVVECFLHSNYTRQVKEPKFPSVSFPDLFPLSQLGLKPNVSDILDPSKSIMGTEI